MGLDIDLYTPKIDIGDDSADDIIIEITGLKSINKFIGLEDTPLYYDNGKFFKVENNKIVYTDIQWKDISGDISESPEIVAVISDLVNEVASDVVDEHINLHNLNEEAHPYIQDVINQNYITLDTKIDNTKEELSEDIQQETLARIEVDTTLQNNIDTLTNNLSAETENRINADNLLRDDIDSISGELAQEIINRQTQDNLLQQQITSNYNSLDDKIDTEISNRTSADITLQNNIDTEISTRQNADNNLQSQIDAIVSSSDVFDIVGTYTELQDYDIATVPVNDIIKVLVDSTHNNAATYYRCVETGSVKSWSYIGAEGAYYTKSESDNRFVAKTITVNGQPLSSNITLTASDVGALPNTTTIPTKTSDLTNDSGFITNAVNNLTNYYLKSETYTKTEVQALIASIPQFRVVVVQSLPVTGERMVLYLVPKEGEAPDVYNEYIWVEDENEFELLGSTAVDLTGYAKESWVLNQGYITLSALNGYATETYVDTGLATKQNTLVSGTNIKTINNETVLGSGNINIQSSTVAYGTSSTAAATATKVVSIPEITELNVGQVIIVKPSATSSVANSKIKLNDFEAYNMRYNNANITTSTDSIVWTANVASMFIFDGTYWQFLGHGLDNNTNTTYASMSVDEGITGTATATRSLTAAHLKQIIQGTKLKGLVTTDDADVVASDSITIGIGKLQAQSTETKSILEDKQNTLNAGTDLEIIRYPVGETTIDGTGSITLGGAKANSLNSVTLYGACSQSSAPTPANPVDITCNNGVIGWDSTNNVITVTGTTETVTDSLNNTATAEMLLAVGDFKDEHELLSGNVTHKFKVLVLNGTETWTKTTSAGQFYNTVSDIEQSITGTNTCLCTHFVQAENNTQTEGLTGLFSVRLNHNGFLFSWDSSKTVAQWQAWLAEQYSNGTPVIVIYPLETPTTETVTAQTLNTQSGNNTLTITQASLNNLALSANYEAMGDVINFTGTIPTVGNGTITFTQGGVAKGTFTTNQAGNTTINLDAGGGTVDQTFDGTSTNAQSGVAIKNAKFIQNTSTASGSLTILGTSSRFGSSINIGESSSIGAQQSVAIGYLSDAYSTKSIALGTRSGSDGDYSIAIGYQAYTYMANSAIQLGYGENSIANSLNIGFYNNDTTHYNWQLLDGTTGLIPDDRLSTNIARTSQIPDISGKQDTLVSGTNIKTINNTSLLGSGNISIPIVTVDQTFDGTSANAQSGVAINGAGFLKNTATGSNALTILGNVSSQSGAVNIGYGSNGTGQDGVAIGQYASASNAMSIAVGSGASALGGSAIQIGAGTNSTANTLSVGLGNNNNYQLLDATGLIPDARLSSNIARTSDVKNSEITVYQGVTSKGSFTLNQSSSASLELDEGVNCENYKTPIPPKGFVNTSSDFVESNLECTASYEPVIDPETDEPVTDPETGEPLVVLGDILYQGGYSSLYQYVNSQFVPYEGTPPETYAYVYPFSTSAGLLYRHWVYVDYINTAYIREDYYTYGELTGDVTSLSTYDGNGKYVGTTEITVTVDGYGEASVEAVFTNEDSTITRTLSRSEGDIYSSSEDNYVIITSDGTTVANMGMKQGSLQPGENIRIDYTTNTISSYVNAIDSVNSTYSRPVTSRSVYYTLTGKEDAIGSEFTGDNIELRVELGHNLPEGYTEYSYIQCNNAYIDTGLHGTEKTRFELCGTFSYAVSTLNLFGDNTTSGSKLSLSSGYWYVGSRSCSVNFMTSYNDNTHLFIGNKYGYTHNATGVAISDTVSSFTTAKTLLIMGVNNVTTPTTYSGYFNLQYAKIYEDNVLVFYGVPAKKNYDNTVGLYDLVSKNFFTKAGGTGRFTTGGSLVPKRKMSIKKIPTMTYNTLEEKLIWS